MHSLDNPYYIQIGNQEALLHNFSQVQVSSLGQAKHEQVQVHLCELQVYPSQLQIWEDLQELDGYHGDGGGDGDGDDGGDGDGGEDEAQVQEKVRYYCHYHCGYLKDELA